MIWWFCINQYELEETTPKAWYRGHSVIEFFCYNPKDTKSEAEVFNQLISEAKQLIRDGKVKEALACYKQAYDIQPSDKLKTKINKCQVC